MKSSKYIVIAAGGTGGHVFPAIALAEQLEKEGVYIRFFTDSRGYKYIADTHYDNTLLKVKSVSSGNLISRISRWLRIITESFRVICIMLYRRPVYVIGFGGYPSFPTVFAALFLQIPCILHEQNSVLGRVNRLFAPWVKTVAMGMAHTDKLPKTAKTIFTGNPIRCVFRLGIKDNIQYHFDKYGPINIVVIGGSQAASIFTEIVPQIIFRLPLSYRSRVKIIHQSPSYDIDRLEKEYTLMNVECMVRPFFTDMHNCFKNTHLVISRAGAGTLAEISMAGRPSILVPLHIATDNHQEKNARLFEREGASLLKTEEDFNDIESMTHIISHLFENKELLYEMASKSRGLACCDAHKRLADVVLD